MFIKLLRKLCHIHKWKHDTEFDGTYYEGMADHTRKCRCGITQIFQYEGGFRGSWVIATAEELKHKEELTAAFRL